MTKSNQSGFAGLPVTGLPVQIEFSDLNRQTGQQAQRANRFNASILNLGTLNLWTQNLGTPFPEPRTF